jgi:hypothetical protein
MSQNNSKRQRREDEDEELSISFIEDHGKDEKIVALEVARGRYPLLKMFINLSFFIPEGICSEAGIFGGEMPERNCRIEG